MKETQEKEQKIKEFLEKGKSEQASNVLQLMDTDYSYMEALTETLLVFDDISKEELELEIYI